MNIKNESIYLTVLSGVVMTSIGLLFILNRTIFSQMDLIEQFALVWIAIGVLYFLNGICDLFNGLQEILEDIKAKKLLKGDIKE